jgi:hypothetical protein
MERLSRENWDMWETMKALPKETPSWRIRQSFILIFNGKRLRSEDGSRCTGGSRRYCSRGIQIAAQIGLIDLIPAAVEAVKQETVKKMNLFGCVNKNTCRIHDEIIGDRAEMDWSVQLVAVEVKKCMK